MCNCGFTNSFINDRLISSAKQCDHTPLDDRATPRPIATTQKKEVHHMW